jgi:hypothetical protein
MQPHPSGPGRPREAVRRLRVLTDSLDNIRAINDAASTWAVPLDATSDDLLDLFASLNLPSLSDSAAVTLCRSSFSSRDSWLCDRFALFIQRCLARFAALVELEQRPDYITPKSFKSTTLSGGNVVVWDVWPSVPDEVKQAVASAHPTRRQSVPHVGRPGLLLCAGDVYAVKTVTLTEEVR